ncbi:hypothetical protein MC378_10045 [Polaribacter sp. MSW13]|uniref:Uncharacterized protein n=1 Tax=Polaribacter marinus TaxID=2916838 RepID=A0A9X1VR93_9FLAO|nr:hypothetical protein [Polaribacter marinus]MCI2229507.1 hypothetical protein [Polaribacter marinus]
MKTTKIASMLLILFGFAQCASTKFEENPPFKISVATYNHWVGGQPGVSGTKVNIYLAEKSNIVFDSLFFLNKKNKIEVREVKGSSILIANYSTSVANNRNINLNLDSKKELTNQVPSIKKFPFELKENEAVISYKIKDKIKYFKIVKLKKAQTDFYPTRPK